MNKIQQINLNFKGSKKIKNQQIKKFNLRIKYKKKMFHSNLILNNN